LLQREVATMSATDYAALEAFVPRPAHRYETFPGNGMGPFVVIRDALVTAILNLATPQISVHISGCRGAGKTTVLRQLAEKLKEANKTVYFFKSAGTITGRQEVYVALDQLMREGKTPVYILLDETQDAQSSNDTLVSLLKNEDGHNVTVIGAGISNVNSVSNQFGRTFSSDRLFLSADDLESTGCYAFFCKDADVSLHGQIRTLVQYIRDYAGGHIYPVMRLSEMLVPVVIQGSSAEDVIARIHANDFRQTEDFLYMADRIRPPPPIDLRPLLYAVRDPMQMENLMKKGFCGKDGKIVSNLLFDIFTESMAIVATGPRYGKPLEPGVEGVKQVLAFALPKLSWEQYETHGGAVEDALTFELILLLTRVDHLKTRLFNPKLVDAGQSGRRPDIYLNTFLDAYVECVRTKGHTASDVKALEEHINRFVGRGDVAKRYDIGVRDYAILHYQVEGTKPLVPTDALLSEIFLERVFTFTMVNKALYRGSVFVC
jgi:hypothetical protein